MEPVNVGNVVVQKIAADMTPRSGENIELERQLKMGETSIEWAHFSFNPWRGCTKVSDGCKNCYAAANISVKLHGIKWGPSGDRLVKAESGWAEPLKWDREAKAAGERHRVFCASLADWLESADTMPAASVPEIRAARLRLLNLIRLTPNLDWLLLSKRMENWRNALEECLILAQSGDPDDKNYFVNHDGDFPNSDLANWINEWLGDEPPANVWLGTSCENQKTADERIPHLLKCPAAVRFLSCEPLLGAINLQRIKCIGAGFIDALDGRGHDGSPAGGEFHKDDLASNQIDWVIVGGESGPGARPMHPDWARSIRDQCVAAGVPFHFKQWGEWYPHDIYATDDRFHLIQPNGVDRGIPWSGWRLDQPLARVMKRVGKKISGRMLDGRTWDEFPNTPEVQR